MYWVETFPRARKPHNCEMCSRTINAGETYCRSACLEDGTATTIKECRHCRALASLIRDQWDNDEGYGRETFADMDITSSDEAIWRAQWGARWRNLDGTLVAIPTPMGSADDLLRIPGA